jgi:AmiR/NasT family two-component response regulator
MAEDLSRFEPTLEHLVHDFAILTPEEILDIRASRVVIERAKGMLMFIYDIDADQAFDVLLWRSQATNVQLRFIAEQLIQDLTGIASDKLVDARSLCDNLLLRT